MPNKSWYSLNTKDYLIFRELLSILDRPDYYSVYIAIPQVLWLSFKLFTEVLLVQHAKLKNYMTRSAKFRRTIKKYSTFLAKRARCYEMATSRCTYINAFLSLSFSLSAPDIREVTCAYAGAVFSEGLIKHERASGDDDRPVSNKQGKITITHCKENKRAIQRRRMIKILKIFCYFLNIKFAYYFGMFFHILILRMRYITWVYTARVYTHTHTHIQIKIIFQRKFYKIKISRQYYQIRRQKRRKKFY